LFAGIGEERVELPTAIYALGEVVEVNTRDTAFPAMGPSGENVIHQKKKKSNDKMSDQIH